MKKNILLIIIGLLMFEDVYSQVIDGEIISLINQAKSNENELLSDQLKYMNQNQPRTSSIDTIRRRVVIENDTLHLRDSIFGRALFANERLTFEPNLSIPTPPNYRIGSGDELVLDLWGNSENSYRLIVSPEGSVQIPGVGPVYVNGKRMDEAESYLKCALGRKYSDLLVSSPGTFIRLSLGRIRSIQVNVVGEVSMSGTYTLPSLATLFHALYVAGGVNNVGSLRQVDLFRHNQRIATIDVYDYLLKGTTCDVALQDGDIVRANIYDKMVQVTGSVKRPMFYELKKDDTLDSLLSYCGGFSGNAYKKAVTIRRKGDIEYEIYTVSADSIGSFHLHDGDVVEVSPILERYANRVRVEGAVYRSGDYALDANMQTLNDLIAVADGLRGDAFVEHAILYRERADRSKTALAVDLTDSLIIPLQPNDLLFVPSLTDIHEPFRVGIYGEVIAPGEYDYYDNITVEDLILRAGGLRESASTVRVDVARRLKNPQSIQSSVIISQLYNRTMNPHLHLGDTNFTLRPFDCVYIRRSPIYQAQSNVEIIGEVLYSGVYTRERNEERVSDIIRRAGGLTSNAYIRGAKLVRKLNQEERDKLESSLRLAKQMDDSTSASMLNIGHEYTVGIDLQRALRHPGSDADVVLREGDVIHIPNYCGTVKISGGVMYPNAVAYSSRKSLRDYIQNGGGYAIGAHKRRVFVVYMNGMVASRKLARIRIEPGCEIIVPMKKRNTMDLLKWLSLTNSTASLAAMVASIVNLSK